MQDAGVAEICVMDPFHFIQKRMGGCTSVSQKRKTVFNSEQNGDHQCDAEDFKKISPGLRFKMQKS